MNLGWKKWGFFSVISEHTWDRRQKRRHAKRAKKSISHPTSAYFPFFSWSIFGNTHSPLSGAILLPTLDDFYDSSFTFFNFSAPQAKIFNIFSSQNRIFLLLIFHHSIKNNLNKCLRRHLCSKILWSVWRASRFTNSPLYFTGWLPNSWENQKYVLKLDESKRCSMPWFLLQLKSAKFL